MTIVSFQVARLRPSVAGAYELSRPEPFADLDIDAREAFALPSGYSHRAVAIDEPAAGWRGEYLAAFPREEGAVEPLLELSERGQPLPATGAALEAIETVNQILAAERTSIGEVRESIRQVWVTLGPDDRDLAVLLFERLHAWALARDTVEDIPELFWLLPWDAFIAHLARLVPLIRSAKRSDEPPDEEPDTAAPELSHVFRYLIPGLAPSLREVTEWRQAGTPIANKAVRAFTRRVRQLPVEKVDPDARRWVAGTLEAVGRKYQHRIYEWVSGSEHVDAVQILVDIYEMLLAWKVPVRRDRYEGRIKWLGRLALAASTGAFSARRVKMRQATIDELRETADRLASEIDFEDRAASDQDWWDRIHDAAWILYAAATMATALSGSPGDGARLASASRRTFQRFGSNVLPYRRTRWATGLAEAFLLEGRACAGAGASAEAAGALYALLEWLDGLDGEKTVFKPHTVQLHRAEALLGLDRAMRDEEARRWLNERSNPHASPAQRALETCEEVIAENFVNRRAWRLWLSAVEPERAVRKIEMTLAAHADENPTGERNAEQETLSWLEYQLAVQTRQRAEDMPDLVLEAFASYLALLGSQPRNLTALDELLDIFGDLPPDREESARTLIDQRLREMSDEPPLTHATLRWVFRDETPDVEADAVRAEHSIPIVGDGTADPAVLRAATEEMKKLVTRSRFGGRVLESVSKWLYDQARSTGEREGLRAVGRLLDPAIEANPRDPVWWSRRADVAIAEEDVATANQLSDRVATTFDDDAIARFQRARLLLLKGELSEADKELRVAAELDRHFTGEAQPHPAITDRRALIALQEGRYEEAEELYGSILADNWGDAAVHYRLGRVYLQSPFHMPDEVLGPWRVGLRLQSSDEDPKAARYAWQTAAGIAALVSRQVNYAPDEGATAKILETLRDMLTVEAPGACTYLVNALRVRGVTDSTTAAVVSAADARRVSRSVAQYLMGRAVHLYIEDPAEWPAFLHEELPGYIEWCARQDVLGDFFAGAKGSYARAYMRVATAGGAAELPELGATGSVGARKLRKLVDHVVRTVGSADYYADAYRYVHGAGGSPIEQLVAAVDEIVGTLARELRPDRQGFSALPEGRPRLLTAFRASVGLERLGGVLELPEAASQLAGYVDLDALLYAQRTQGVSDWVVQGDRLQGVADAEVPTDERRSYARAGITWSLPNGETGRSCSISLTEAELESPSEEREFDLA